MITKRITTRIGDVFSLKINDVSKRYFQLVAFDLTQLNSDLIKAFKEEYPLDSQTELSEILKGEVDFYAHCVTKLGIKMNLWEKLGNSSYIGDIQNVLFRCTNDYGHKEGEGPIRKSKNWYVWNINDKNFRRVGNLQGEDRNAFIGLVINPIGIVELFKGNKYPVNYPDFE
jgi:hypothetical protein